MPNQTFLCGTCKFELRAIACDLVDDIWALLGFLLQSLWEDTYSQMIYFNLLESTGRIQIDSPHHSSFLFFSDNAIFLNYLSKGEASIISSKDLNVNFILIDINKLLCNFHYFNVENWFIFFCIHRNNVSLICLG